METIENKGDVYYSNLLVKDVDGVFEVSIIIWVFIPMLCIILIVKCYKIPFIYVNVL